MLRAESGYGFDNFVSVSLRRNSNFDVRMFPNTFQSHGSLTHDVVTSPNGPKQTVDAEVGVEAISMDD